MTTALEEGDVNRGVETSRNKITVLAQQTLRKNETLNMFTTKRRTQQEQLG